MSKPTLRHSIRVVALRTGLSPHVIRVWEKRYGTVHPDRTGGNQRVYSESDVQRLTLLRQATEAGHPIRNVTHLPEDQLRALLNSTPRASAEPTRLRIPELAPARSAPDLIAAAHEAVFRLDGARLEQVLEEGAVSLGQGALLAQVVAPLVQRIGDDWQEGRLKVAHEHLASAVIRTFLANASRPMALHAAAPVILATTPAGQIHEIGAALAAAVAGNQGWRVVYLGASLPAEEIAAAAGHRDARVVALSIVHPADDPALPGELRRLRRLLPPGCRLVAGGRAVSGYREALGEAHATVCETLGEFSAALDLLRQSAN
ncbi:MAG: MerR family transcriptional regulator [Verrucomicrobia bacterium]|nr:MerR family transcriptional regulator [Verrucomicrobiota bacterium]